VVANAPLADLCPNCAVRPIEDDETGFCLSCSDNYGVERYWEKDRPIVEARRADWKARTSSPAALRERQRRHRLREAIRSREAPSEWTDPWELGHECLQHLERVRQAMGSNVIARDHLRTAEELVRQRPQGRRN
jgi:hypothetical protein